MKNKIVITGGPNTGKTTLFNSLKAEYLDAAFVGEPATAVLDGLQDTSLIDDPLLFCSKCIEQSVSSEHLASKQSDLLIQDRSLIDTIAYARRDGIEESLPELPKLVKQASYTGAIVCEFIRPYHLQGYRYESEQEAIRTHSLIKQVYEELGIDSVVITSSFHAERINQAKSFIDRKIS